MNSITEYRHEFTAAADNALLGSKAVAAYIGKSVAWLNLKAVHGGGIPYTKLGHNRLYMKKDVLDWIRQEGQRVTSTSQYVEV